MDIIVHENGYVEKNIAPPMRMVVTLPLTVDGDADNYVIYVGVNSFAKQIPSASELKNLVEELCLRIRRY